MTKDIILPKISFYNQDIVDLYDEAWGYVKECFITKKTKKGALIKNYVTNPNHKTFNYFYSLLPSFFLVYSSEEYSACDVMDFFYQRQESDGAIWSDYDVETGEKVNNSGVTIPIFSWVEYNYYIRYGNKKRLKEIEPKLINFYNWFKGKYMDKSGLFCVPKMDHITGNVDRSQTYYPVDLNAAMALFCSHLADIGELLNDKDVKLSFKKQYFALKNHINTLMWKDNFYYDLDKDLKPVGPELISAYFVLLARLSNEEELQTMLSHLRNPKMFATENPFPTIPVKNKKFSKDGNGFYGGVSSILTFITVKAIEASGDMQLAKESTLKHAFFILEAEHLNAKNIPADFWDVYKPNEEGPSIIWTNAKRTQFTLPRQHFVPALGLIAITLLIEIIIGFDISMSQKIVTWVMDDYELLGIKNFYLKKNYISLECTKRAENDTWIIKLNSDKLYYLRLIIRKQNIDKNLPIPAGKCSLLPEKFND